MTTSAFQNKGSDVSVLIITYSNINSNHNPDPNPSLVFLMGQCGCNVRTLVLQQSPIFSA